jgi:hypothetical protein
METVTFRAAKTTRRKIALGALFCVLAFVAWIAALLLSGVVVASRVPVSLPYGISVDRVGDYVFVSGTWVIDGDKQGFPLQTTEIQCDRTLLRCSSATAQIGYGGQLTTMLGHYQVVEWGADRVVFVYTSPLCVSYV